MHKIISILWQRTPSSSHYFFLCCVVKCTGKKNQLDQVLAPIFPQSRCAILYKPPTCYGSRISYLRKDFATQSQCKPSLCSREGTHKASEVPCGPGTARWEVLPCQFSHFHNAISWFWNLRPLLCNFSIPSVFMRFQHDMHQNLVS